MSENIDEIAKKYEEKFVRRLGEVAILLHLARSPEGSHAYEMRSKASEIIFQKRNEGIDFLESHLKILTELKKLISGGSVDSKEKKKLILKEIKKYPILNFNTKIQRILASENEFASEDIEYVQKIHYILNEAAKEMKDTSVIWGNLSGIYPTIESLEKNGLIKLDREDSDGGRLKKMYVITEVGKRTVSQIMSTLLDMSAFIFETERNFIHHRKEGFMSSRFNPFRRTFITLSEDLTPGFKKRIHCITNKSGKPFVKVMMDQGVSEPRIHVLLHHPEMLENHLDSVESEEEKILLKSHLKDKLLNKKNQIDKLLEKL